MTSRATNEMTSKEAQAHEATHGKPAQGRKWKKLTLPDGFYKQDHDACWCGKKWDGTHDDEFHPDVWTQVDLTPVEAHEATHGVCAPGWEWRLRTQPAGEWRDEDRHGNKRPCWCGELWGEDHEDAHHKDVWAQVRIAPTVLGKRKASGGRAESPIDLDELEDEAEESEDEEESEEESEEKLSEGYQMGWYGPVPSEE
jgi:hypothetical protein